MGDEKNFWGDEWNDLMATIDIGNPSSTDDWKVWLDQYNLEMDQFGPGQSNTLGTNNISLTGGGEEMLRIAEDGFYVRGVRVEADAKEAQAVYSAFKQWMSWAIMNGQLGNDK